MLSGVAARRIPPILIRSSSSFPVLADEVLFPLEMGEEAVEEEQPGGAARNRAADAGEVVKLAECPGEGGLPALVGPGDDGDALAALQPEIVGDHRGALCDELAGQRQVEGADGADVL